MQNCCLSSVQKYVWNAGIARCLLAASGSCKYLSAWLLMSDNGQAQNLYDTQLTLFNGYSTFV